MSSWMINGEIQPPRACDQCHALKERCEWVADGAQCERCLRLQNVCETIRPKGRPGRKPGVRGKLVSSELRPGHRPGQRSGSDNNHLSFVSGGHRMRSSGHVTTITRCISELGDVPAADQQVVQRLFLQRNLVEIFSVGSNFTERVREYTIPHLMLSKTTLLDGLLACAISWAGDVEGAGSQGRLSTCYRHASSALATLTSLQVTNYQTMTDCLMLGALISTFALRLRLNDVQAISGRTLSLIEPVYTSSDPAKPELLLFLSCMVMWDLRGCLFSCAVPALRFRPPAEAYADRHVGLCATLLPLFHDICKVSHMLAHGKTHDADITEELEAVQRSVRQWQPVVPEDFTTHFNAIDVAHMLCQAQVMRLAALLVTHRLQYPFGVNDAPAQILSTAILTQLEMTYATTKQPVRCIDLPLLVACLELKEHERQKWYLDIGMFAGFSPQFGEHLQSTLASFWATMDLFGTISWSDLTATGSPFLRNAL